MLEAINSRSDCALYPSIDLGGMLVVAGNEAGLAALLAEAPPTPAREPLRLVNHGPFHTPLMQGSSERAMELPAEWIAGPGLPMIDGRGHIWRPHASDAEALRRYTFATQILEPYDFTRALQVAVKEYAPDRIILLGPGDTLGGAIAQALIAIRMARPAHEAGLRGAAGLARAAAALDGPRGSAGAGDFGLDLVAERALDGALDLLGLALQRLPGAFRPGVGVAAFLLGFADRLIGDAFDLVLELTHDKSP